MPAQQQREDCWEQETKWDSPERSKQGKSLRGGTTGTHAQATGRGKGREWPPQAHSQHAQKHSPNDAETEHKLSTTINNCPRCMLDFWLVWAWLVAMVD